MSRRRLTDDPVFYRIRYSLLALELQSTTDEVVAEKGDKGTGRLSEQALEQVYATNEELRELGWRWAGSRPPRLIRLVRRRRGAEFAKLGEFLDGVLEPATVVLYWSCLVNEGCEKEVEQALDRKLGGAPGGRPQRVEELCIDARRRRRRLRQIDRRGLRRVDRRRLRQGLPRIALWRRKQRRAWLEDYLAVLAAPPTYRRRPLVGRILIRRGLGRLRPAPRSGYRVRYNLACLHSRLASRSKTKEAEKEHLDKGLEQWRWCLAEVSGAREKKLQEWARQDPGMKALADAGLLGDGPAAEQSKPRH